MSFIRIPIKQRYPSSHARYSTSDDNYKFVEDSLVWAADPQTNPYLAQAELDEFEDSDTSYVNIEALAENWSEQKGRFFFVHNGVVCSVYRCVIDNYLPTAFVLAPFDCAIILMSCTSFAGGVFKGKELIEQKEFQMQEDSLQLRSSSSNDKDSFNERILEVLNQWKPLMASPLMVFVRCAEVQSRLFFKGKGLGGKNSKYKLIPFSTARPSVSEIKKAWRRLTTVVEHGDEETIKKEAEMQQAKKDKPKKETENQEVNLFVSQRKQVKEKEERRWPGLSAALKGRLHDALTNNNYQQLQDVVRSGDKVEICDYLSFIHNKLNGRNFLHLAVRHSADQSVKFLLNIGVDPTITDSHGKFPFEYSTIDKMREVFKKCEQDQPDKYDWNKCLPDSVEKKYQPKRHAEVDTRNNEDE